MIEGLLWLDADPKRDLTTKVERAALRYKRKFGRAPDRCYVNQAMIDGTQQVNGIQVIPAHNVLRHHFWIGVEDEGQEPVEPEPEETPAPVPEKPRAKSGNGVYRCKACGAEWSTAFAWCAECGEGA